MEAKKPLFLEQEDQARQFWKKAGIFELSVKREAPKGDYVFYDGPPFATGTMHYGHMVGNIIKDVVPRFWTMNGYRVERRWGWDCHGLPIENLVEKELGITNKRQIEELGVEKFNELCRSKVLSYVDDWKAAVEKLGRWVDMENDYKTMDAPFMESVWWVFKQLWDKGLIYEGYRSMHVCPRCETTLSQAEVSENYKDIKDLSVMAKFELAGEPGTYLLAWTTTPWTLPGNVALAVGEENNYSYLQVQSSNSPRFKEGEIYILATNKLPNVLDGVNFGSDDGIITFNLGDGAVKVYRINAVVGVDLVGKRYKPLFDSYVHDSSLKNLENGWKVYAADFVSEEEGTGIVHIAPGFGEDDLNLSKEKNLPFVQHVGMDGVIKPEVKELAGLHVKPIEDVTATDVAVIKYLAGKGLLFSKEKYEHSYPHCWRCDTPLINYATTSWFVSVMKVKDAMLENAKAIGWSPDYIKEGRFGNWLEGARDWSISRQRFWASVMPLWRCDACDHREVFGSLAELTAKSGQTVTDLHKHIVDKIMYACTKCPGGTMKRVPDVLDTWFDSGSMPYAQVHYPFEHKNKFEKNFPAQFIAEGIDQTRTWFYYLHVLASALFNRPAFKNVVVNGTVQAEDGKKMSKRLQNYPDPLVLMDKYGADALRAYFLASPVVQAENLNFSEKGVEEALRKNIMILWNVYSFYEMYAADDIVDDVGKKSEVSDHVLDRWIMARLNQLIQTVTAAMTAYDLPRAMRPITEFIDDLSTWYLRRSRDRFKDDGSDEARALATMKHILIELAKVMAPFTPFIAEALWQKVAGHNFTQSDRSVHLEVWPTATEADETILVEMKIVREIVEMGLAKRDEAKIKVRQPLQRLQVSGEKLMVQNAGLLDLITDELNVKEVFFAAGGVTGTEGVELDTTMTPELEREGLKREIVRVVNQMRKQAGLGISDRIRLAWHSDDEVVKVVFEEYTNEIKGGTLALDVVAEKTVGAQEQKINHTIVYLNLTKV